MILATAAGCIFAPKYPGYARCDAGQCAPGTQCLAEEDVCVPLCGETAQCQVAITTTSLPDATMCVAYTEGLVAAGGIPPYSWSLVGGSLPSGVTVDASGVISGMPTESNTFMPTFQVEDHGSPPNSASASLALVSGSGALTVTSPASLPAAKANQPYNERLTVSGGTPPHTWSLCSGALPSGLSLSTTGDLTGTPASAGTTPFVVQVTDSVNLTGAKALSLSVTP